MNRSLPNIRTLLLASALGLPLALHAAEPEAALGTETKAWVDLQQGGTQAEGATRPMPGEIADNVYQRYVDSFKQPIPGEFKRQSTGDAGNASGQ